MHITKLTLENFRGFEHLELEPGKLCLLVGRNGSGKTSVLRAIAAMLAERGRVTGPKSINPLDLKAETSGLKLSAYLSNGEELRLVRPTSGIDPWPQTAGAGLFVITEGPVALWLDAHRSAETGALPTVIPWFIQRENLENEKRLREDQSLRDPALQILRSALKRFMRAIPGGTLGNPWIRRTDTDSYADRAGTLVFEKDGQTLALHQLSDGEQTLLLTVMELARRQFVAYPESADPLSEPGLLLIDEVALHLHPSWQRAALPALQATFPGLQIIATTHSPQVMASVPTKAIQVLEDFKVYKTGVPVEGRDSNSILEEVMGVPPRPHGTQELLAQVSEHIDNDRLPQARTALRALKATLTEQDPEIVRLQTMLDFLAS